MSEDKDLRILNKLQKICEEENVDPLYLAHLAVPVDVYKDSYLNNALFHLSTTIYWLSLYVHSNHDDDEYNCEDAEDIEDDN